jgi:ribonuclease HI
MCEKELDYVRGGNDFSEPSLTQLARHTRVQLIWVPGHEGIVGNETADQLARTGSEHPFTGPEPALWYLSWSCQESGQGLDEQKSQKILGIHS